MLEVWKKQFTWDKILLRHKNPQVFVQSKWQQNDGTTVPYLTYRWAVTIFFFVTWVVSILDVNNSSSISSYHTKWLIYLTNWGYTTCMLQSLICSLMTTCSFWAQKKSKGEDRINNPLIGLYPFYWALHIVATATAFGITILYWTVIYDKSKMPLDAMNIFVHGTNSLFMLFELILTAHPVRLVHFYWPVLFGIVYATFSAIYFFAGGTAKDGKTYIYPILNWNNPGKTVLVCFGVLVFMIVLHVLNFAVHCLKNHIYKKIYNQTKEESSSMQINKGFEEDLV